MAVRKVSKKVNNENSGLGLDDAFGDDEGVEYAKPNLGKKRKRMGEDEEELEEEIEGIEREVGVLSVEQPVYEIKQSKPISELKKGDKIKIDGKEFTIDGHYVLIDHKTTKEMAIEIFDSDDGDFQIRYFDDQIETTMEFYELREIMYVKRVFRKIEW